MEKNNSATEENEEKPKNRQEHDPVNRSLPPLSPIITELNNCQQNDVISPTTLSPPSTPFNSVRDESNTFFKAEDVSPFRPNWHFDNSATLNSDEREPHSSRTQSVNPQAHVHGTMRQRLYSTSRGFNLSSTELKQPEGTATPYGYDEFDDGSEDVCFPTSPSDSLRFEELNDFILTHRNTDSTLGNNENDEWKLSRTSTNTVKKKLTVSWSGLPCAPNEIVRRFTRFSFFATDRADTLHFPTLDCLIDPDIVGTSQLNDLFSSAHGSWWLDCVDPTPDELRAISKTFRLHPLTEEDIRSQEPQEKAEFFNNYYYVAFHAFNINTNSSEYLMPVPTYVVVFAEGVLSFRYSSVLHFSRVRRRIRKLRDHLTITPDWICYAIIDDITDWFAPTIQEIEVEADEIENSVYINKQGKNFATTIERIGLARRKTMTIMRLLMAKPDVVKTMSKRCFEESGIKTINGGTLLPKHEIGLYLEDIHDHLSTMQYNLSVYEKIFARSHANYLAQISVRAFYSSEKATKVLGQVSMIGTVVLPLNFVTGLWGMNVPVPGQTSNGLAWFLVIVASLIGLSILLSIGAQIWMMVSEKEADEDQEDTESSRLMGLIKHPSLKQQSSSSLKNRKASIFSQV